MVVFKSKRATGAVLVLLSALFCAALMAPSVVAGPPNQLESRLVADDHPWGDGKPKTDDHPWNDRGPKNNNDSGDLGAIGEIFFYLNLWMVNF